MSEGRQRLLMVGDDGTWACALGDRWEITSLALDAPSLCGVWDVVLFLPQSFATGRPIFDRIPAPVVVCGVPASEHAGWGLAGAEGVVVEGADIEELHAALLEARQPPELSDPLTGLLNRSGFLAAIEAAASARRPQPAAVILIDLDEFTLINDSLGHDRGDVLLVTFAERLQGGLRHADRLARVGADEFAVLFVGDNAAEVASPLAERLCARLREPLVSGGQEVYPSACVGIALSRGEEAPGELLRAADTAVRRAKRGGRGGRALYLRTMRDEARARLKLEVEIRQALRDRQLVLYYQPVIHTFTGQIEGFEALVRWNHPRRGVLAPGAFLPLAEETGLILPMGWQVLEQACQQAALWPAPTSVSVNLAAAQLVSPELLPRVERALSRSGLPPTRLKLEITESCLLDHRRVPVHLFETLAELGVSVMLDDFGTGYCSLSYLERYLLQGLKIDRSFIRELVDNPRRQAITRRILDLGRDLGMDVVAEGIETEAERQCLQAMGCDLLQGYYFARPMPVADIDSFFLDIQRKSA